MIFFNFLNNKVKKIKKNQLFKIQVLLIEKKYDLSVILSLKDI